MPKGVQRSNKLAKKPKKTASGPSTDAPIVSSRPVPPTTAVLPKGKLKNKPTP